ncbi:MAG: exosortase/archaeosortase family protein [Candidatus Aenigmarchaeota archaeon]|nr:exosortase/archaeosortase family protein [Candidatus Aenigmarchaeota archaeon]
MDAADARLRQTLVFLTTLALLAVPVYVISLTADLLPLQLLVADHSAALLDAMGFAVSREAALVTANGFTFLISPDSTGWKSLLFLGALVLAVPGTPWRKKGIGLAIGLPLVYAANLGRVAAIVLAEQAWGWQAAALAHDVLWQVGLAAVVLACWLAWWTWARRGRRDHSISRTKEKPLPSRRRKGDFGIDFAVAIGVFLLFVTWAFVLYQESVPIAEETAREALDQIADLVLDNLTVDTRSLPARFGYANSTTVVLYLDYRWPFGQNTTAVLFKGSSQACNITDNRLYWQSVVSPGDNYFTVTFSEQGGNLRCAGGFSTAGAQPATGYAAERGEAVSLDRILHLNATNYTAFRSRLGITRNFNLTISNSSGTVLSYGLRPPPASDVFARTLLHELEETGGNLTLRVLVW